MKKPKMFIEGNVAEVFEDMEKRHIKIICQQKNFMFSIEDVNGIQLGDHVEIEGKLKIEKIKLNGIEINV
ncbi:MAG: hypothetical protein V2I62_03355 [Bacteroidales bacterium]|jgi:hypothetical protein|nr:hypothetical protein [Bacteroidales bacterium]